MHHMSMPIGLYLCDLRKRKREVSEMEEEMEEEAMQEQMASDASSAPCDWIMELPDNKTGACPVVR